MRIVFFEVMPGEQEMITAHLPPGHDVVFLDEALTAQTIDKARGAPIISVFVKSDITASVIDQLPDVKLLVTRSMGTDHIDMDHAKAKGISVGNVTTYAAHPVAEFTFALLLAVARKICPANTQLRATASFDQTGLRGYNLFGKTIGIVGTGRIGKNVISIAKGFGMNVIAYDPMPDAAYAAAQAFSYASLHDLAMRADIMSLHAPYTPDTHHLIGTEVFASMKKGSILINTARGELIDTHTLVAALESGILWGAGLDVLEGERALKDELTVMSHATTDTESALLAANHVLIDHPRVVVTPHIAFETAEAQQEIIRVTTETITQFLSSPDRQN